MSTLMTSSRRDRPATLKDALRAAVSAVALSGLLAGVAGAGPVVSDLPLKTSVLVKPNVIFGMDDSGSMDWEVLLDTESGLVHWNGASAWDTVGNRPRRSTPAGFAPYAYLFPLGTAEGAQLYEWDSIYGQAVPPTNQFAWLRSARYNPIYYDSRVTYPAWSPAYFGGSLKTYGNASATAARAHPAVPASATLNLSTNWTNADGRFTSNGFRFYVQAGMTLPAGTRVNSTGTGAGNRPCEGWGEVTTTADQTVQPGRACWASIPYYPATFWHPEGCTLGANCVAAPDGSGTLRRYEIRPGTTSYPSGRSHADELQNFANWFQYYRKRKLMLAASMGRVLEGISGLRLGVVAFNENPTVTMFDADATSAASNRFAAAGEFYLNSMVPLGTPTHQNVKNIANQFETNTSIVQYACQRNSMFIVTDGFSNTTTTTVPAYDSTRWGGTRPYTTTPTGSLADLALAYYTRRLRPDLPAGRLPPSASTEPNADKNPDLHITTYGMTLGVRGSIWPFPYPKKAGDPATRDPFVDFPTWPTPVADNPSMIDDQYHATINGRGQMYLASSPDETLAGIRAGLDDILSQRSTQGATAVSSVNLSRGDSRAYMATYDPAGWSGNLVAVGVDPATGDIGSEPAWSAAALLDTRNQDTRVIATWGPAGRTSFRAATVGATVNPGGTYGATADVMAYLRGDRSLEGSSFRKRSSVLGAIINSEPVVDRETGVVYVASGEGMLHAFDTQGGDAGRELWAYVPRQVLPNIGQTVQRSYSFRTLLDGSPVIGKLEGGGKLLVSGMGAAGRGYFAIDVAAPRGLTESTLPGRVQWEFPAVGDSATQAKVGQTVGRPHVVRTTAGSSVVLVTSGYNSTTDGRGRLWVLRPSDGAILKEYVTPEGTLANEAGLAQVSPFGEGNGSVRYVYGGDLLGNVWRFDLDLAAGATGAVTKVAQLRGPTGLVQPVTTAPELLGYQGKRIVHIGTGQLLSINDFGNNNVQSFYAIADGTLLSNARSSLVRQTLGAGGTISANPVDWSTGRGWYVDLPAGEQVNTRPSMAYGAISFVTNKAGSSDCSASSRLYVIDVLTGSRFQDTDAVSVISETSNATGVTLLLTRDGRRLVATTRRFNDGGSTSRPIPVNAAIAPGKNAWREIRR